MASRRGLVVLLLVLVAAVLAAAVVDRVSTARRSAEAPAVIVSSVFQPGGGTKDRQVRGHHLQYTYAFAGTVYPGVIFVEWDDVTAHRPKVCLAPDDPRDHLLVDGMVKCGVVGFP